MSYILIKFLPYDIVEYIFIINKQNKAANIVINYYRYSNTKNETLKNVVKMFRCDTYHVYDVTDYLQFHLYKNLHIIYKSIYNREKYDHYFWQCFLHLLSKMLMYFYNIILISNKNICDKNIFTIILKKSILLWFQLCQKYNIKLVLLLKKINNINSQYLYVWARNISKINNFYTFLYAPRVLYNNQVLIENTVASNYLFNVTGVA